MPVYFIAENENDDHNSLRVKIGRSRDIQVRLRTLQTGSPYDLKLMGWIESDDDKQLELIGLVFSVAWHCVNKGSKFWQENWENHVELLEDKVFGPLYKTLTKRPDHSSSISDSIVNFFVAPKPFSVSKVNQLVSTFIALIWVLILFSSVGNICFSGCNIDWERALPVSLALATCAGFWLAGKSHEGKHNPEVYLRETAVSEMHNPSIHRTLRDEAAHRQ